MPVGHRPAEVAVRTEDRLRPFVPGFVSEWLRDCPRQHHRAVAGTLAFVDISGFTRLTERLGARGKAGAEEMSDLLDATFGELLAVAYGYGAWLVKWGGDAVLLLFQDERHAARACTAAYEMRRTMARVGNLRTSAGPVRLRMSVGVHSGSFDFFLVGSLHHELIVTGPAATTTARMEAVAEAGEVAVSPATAALLPRRALGAPKQEGVLLARSPRAARLEASGRPRADVDLAGCLPAATRDHLLAGGSDGEHRQVAVAFVEFSGVDALLTAQGPGATAAAVGEVISSCQESAQRHGVTFWETDINAGGGKVMLVAGAPTAHGDDEDRMLATAREIVDAAAEGPAPALRLRVGVNCGRVFSGEFGPSYRRTYSVKGDAVNLAARLMAKAGTGEIYASAAVIERARTAFEAAELAPFLVKGKAHPVRAFRVGRAGHRDAVETGSQAPLAGRDAELGALLEAWRLAAAGEGRACVVVGEAGLGKSRLVREAVMRMSPPSVVVLRGDEYHSTTAYAPFRRLLLELMRLDGDPAPPVVVEALRRNVAECAPGLLPWLPLLGAVAGVRVAATPESAALDEQFRKSRQEQVARELLQRMLPGPAVLVFEDTHLMDDASRDLLRLVMSEAAETPWLVLATTRADGRATPELPTLRLEPLDALSSSDVVTALTDDAPLAPHTASALVARADGNPMFLVELVQAIRTAPHATDLPDSVEGVVAARIDGLAPPDRALLRAASVLGSRVDRDLLARLVATDGAPVDDAAVARLSQFLVAEGTGHLRFHHTLARETAYEGLPFSRRRVLHERAGRLLEARAGARRDEIADVLSLHFFHAQQYDEAWRYGRLAGRRMLAVAAHAEAAELLERALHSARHLDGLGREVAMDHALLGDARFRLGEFAAARESFRRARAGLSHDAVEVARLQLKVAQANERMGALADALRWLSRARRLLQPQAAHPPAAQLRAEIAAHYALVRHYQGRELDAVRWCLRAIDEARAAGARHAEATALLYLDVSETLLGRGDGTPARQALAIWRRLGDAWQEARTHNQLGIRAYYGGAWDAAVADYERAHAASLRAGDEWMASIVAGNIAEILSDQGRLAEAEPLLRDALRVWRASGAASPVAFGRSYLARVAARDGRHEDALELYAAARDAFASGGEHLEVLETDARIAECLVLQGRATAALAAADAALVRAAAMPGVVAQLPLLHRVRGLALAELGDVDGARSALAESLRVGRLRDAGHEVAWTLDAMVHLAAAGGAEPDPAVVRDRNALVRGLGIVRIAEPPLPRVVVDVRQLDLARDRLTSTGTAGRRGRPAG